MLAQGFGTTSPLNSFPYSAPDYFAEGYDEDQQLLPLLQSPVQAQPDTAEFKFARSTTVVIKNNYYFLGDPKQQQARNFGHAPQEERPTFVPQNPMPRCNSFNNPASTFPGSFGPSNPMPFPQPGYSGPPVMQQPAFNAPQHPFVSPQAPGFVPSFMPTSFQPEGFAPNAMQNPMLYPPSGYTQPSIYPQVPSSYGNPGLSYGGGMPSYLPQQPYGGGLPSYLPQAPYSYGGGMYPPGLPSSLGDPYGFGFPPLPGGNGFPISHPDYPATPPPAANNDDAQIQQLLTALILVKVVKAQKEEEKTADDTSHHDDTPTPTPLANRQELLAKILDNYDDLKGAGHDSNDSTFGQEDVDAILAHEENYSSELVHLARDLKKDPQLIESADWVNNQSSDKAQDKTADRLQYLGTLDLLQDHTNASKALNYIKTNFDKIAANGGNSTALERSDIDAEIAHLNQGSDDDKAIAATLSKTYYNGADGDAKKDIVTILANASGNNSSSAQTITRNGLNKVIDFVADGDTPEHSLDRTYEFHGSGFSGWVTGDPHFESLDGHTHYDIQPPPGSTVNVLADKGILLNAKVDAWYGNDKATVMKDIGLRIGGNRIEMHSDDTGAPKLNGTSMVAGTTYNVSNGTVKWENGKLVFHTSEYDGTISQCGSDGHTYFNLALSIGSNGNRADGVSSQGLLGTTANFKVNGTVDPHTGEGGLGGYKLEDYYTVGGDLFGEATNTAVRRFNG